MNERFDHNVIEDEPAVLRVNKVKECVGNVFVFSYGNAMFESQVAYSCCFVKLSAIPRVRVRDTVTDVYDVAQQWVCFFADMVKAAECKNARFLAEDVMYRNLLGLDLDVDRSIFK